MRSPVSDRGDSKTTWTTNPSQSVAIVPYRPPPFAHLFDMSESGNQPCTSVPEGGIAAEISVSTSGAAPDDRLDLDSNDDDELPVGSGFVYDDAVISELLNDRYGVQRAETKRKKSELIGTSTTVAGQVWQVRGDIPESHDTYDDFIELGLRSNDIDVGSLPKRFRTRSDLLLGFRSSPRFTQRESRHDRDEAKAINSIFMTLFPVNWKQSLKRLNKTIEHDQTSTRKTNTKTVSDSEYWTFIGLLILCAVQKSGGVDGLYRSQETESMIERVNASKHMSYTRFKFIKKYWVSQFHLDLTDEEKETNKWWRVGYLVHGFNQNRQSTVASSRIKTFDESMSAYRPQTRKNGNLPNISFILRAESLGTELKTVASTGSNDPII